MDSLDPTDLKSLLKEAPSPCVSIYMPKHRVYPDAQQDGVSLRNLLRRSEEKLRTRGETDTAVEEILGPGRALLQDPSYWEDASDSMAVFLAPKFARNYRLPVALPEKLIVGDRFHAKPLFPVVFDDGRYYVLTLSKGQVRFYEGRRDVLVRHLVDGMPESLAEVMRYDEIEKETQTHTYAGNRMGGASGDISPHGHGGGEDDEKKDLLRFVRAIGAAVDRYLAGARVPIVLCGVEYLQSLYRDAHPSANVLHEGIHGNPDALEPDAIRQKAWALVEPLLRKERDEAAARFREMDARPSTTTRATTAIEEVVPAAMHGRVERLFVALDREAWGDWDSKEGKVRTSADLNGRASDLLDLAAAQTFLHGGVVYAVPVQEMPVRAPVAALLRY